MSVHFCRHCNKPLGQKRFADRYCTRSCYRKAWCAARYKRHVRLGQFIPGLKDAPQASEDSFAGLEDYTDIVTRTESFVVGLALAFVLFGAIVW